MSEPVVLGFTAGAAILILATQVPTMLGVSGAGGILENAFDALRAPGDWQLEAVAVSAVAIAVVLSGRRLHPLFPGVLVVVVGGVVWSRITEYDGRIVGDLPQPAPRSVARPPVESCRVAARAGVRDRVRRVRRAGGDRPNPRRPGPSTVGRQPRPHRPRCRQHRVGALGFVPDRRFAGAQRAQPDGRGAHAMVGRVHRSRRARRAAVGVPRRAVAAGGVGRDRRPSSSSS